jgi:hypothetical protein
VITPAGRPGERRDPLPLAFIVREDVGPNAEPRLGAAAMSAIALTLGSRRFAGTTWRCLCYFFAGAILVSAGLAASGLASPFVALSSGLSVRSTLAVSRSFAT